MPKHYFADELLQSEKLQAKQLLARTAEEEASAEEEEEKEEELERESSKKKIKEIYNRHTIINPMILYLCSHINI